MTTRLLALLAQVSLATSIAVIFVAVLRKPLRGLAGTRISYWLWIVVPATGLAMLVPSLLPAPIVPVLDPLHKTPLQDLFTNSVGPAFQSRHVVAWIMLASWLAGVIAMITLVAVRQRSFVRSLGHTQVDGDGLVRSDRIAAPMLVGAWRPRVLIPMNFETLYSDEDRTLMLAHERTHREKGDPLSNTFAVGWLCTFWFNPLMFWAMTQFRFDQELACDALVLSRMKVDKRRYANALLNAQLKSESVWLMQIGCHWQSSHPLKERIAMLKHTSPSPFRQIGGASLTIALVASATFVFSSGFAESPRTTQLLADATPTEKKIAVDAQDMTTREVIEMIARKGNQNVLVSDKVTGKITVHLKDVTYREALHVVALSHGLVAKQDGNITIVDVAP